MQWLLGLLLFFPMAVRADEPENTLQVRLISEVSSIAAGKKFYVGLHLQHPPNAHTYWKHPGIVGIATTVKWELPAGFTAAEIEWPAPQAVKMAGHEAQGYEGETLLMIPITPPPKLVSNVVTLTAKVSWMCCGKTCQPATDVPFSITLPVAESAEADIATAPLFDKFRNAVPRGSEGCKQITVHRGDGGIILTLHPVYRRAYPFLTPAKIHFFTADGQVDSDQPQKIEMSAEGTITLTLTASKTGPEQSESLPGLVVIPTGKIPRLLEINPRY